MAVGWISTLFLLMVFVVPAGGLAYRRYLGITTGKALLMAALCIISVISNFAVNAPVIDKPVLWGNFLPGTFENEIPRYLQNQVIITIVFRSFLPFFLLPFLVNLYRKWIGNIVTDQEKLPSMDGIRAWFSIGNLICAACISICVWKGFSPGQLSTLFWMLLLTVGILVFYPLLNMLSQIVELRMNPREDLSAAREKILEMLEQGKITPEESAELLSALKDKPKESGNTKSSAPPPSPDEC